MGFAADHRRHELAALPLRTVTRLPVCSIPWIKTRAYASHVTNLNEGANVANRLDGKVAAVTGGDQGIGRAIVERLAQEGADIALCFRSNKAGADEVVTVVQKMGRKGAAIQCDVGKVADGQRFVADAVAALGQVDILVNNAGLERRADFWDVTEQDYDTVLNVNLKGPFFVTQAFVKHRMQAKAGGKVINISSVHEELPFPHFTSYCASKGGVKMMTRNLSIELAPLGITINSIAPGAVETPINKNLLNDPVKLKSLLENIPLNRLGKPEDVASVAAFLASSDSDYVTGTTYFVDGGLTWNYQEQ
jgi:glucose 1-dehydrogenase